MGAQISQKHGKQACTFGKMNYTVHVGFSCAIHMISGLIDKVYE